MESRELKLSIANAIVNNLWLKGLLTEEEKDRIINKNKQNILSLNTRY